MTEAIKFVMEFYNISGEDAVTYYWDEVESYMILSIKIKEAEQ